MTDENDDFLPDDIPHDVVIQEALAPFLGGFEAAEEASTAAHRALVVTYGRAIVSAEDLLDALDALVEREDVCFGDDCSDVYCQRARRLRAALPERTTE